MIGGKEGRGEGRRRKEGRYTRYFSIFLPALTKLSFLVRPPVIAAYVAIIHRPWIPSSTPTTPGVMAKWLRGEYSWAVSLRQQGSSTRIEPATLPA